MYANMYKYIALLTSACFHTRVRVRVRVRVRACVRAWVGVCVCVRVWNEKTITTPIPINVFTLPIFAKEITYRNGIERERRRGTHVCTHI